MNYCRPLLALIPLALGCAGPCFAENSGFDLQDIAHERGLIFQHKNGASAERHLPETMGSGVAFIDYDRDGDLDLYTVQSGSFPPDGSDAAANKLWRNEGNGHFKEVPRAAGADDRGYGQGVLAADLDGDGYSDLYITNWGPDAFYRNRGDGSFENATTEAGLGLDGWSSSAAAADADGDGDLDLYVARYLEYDPSAAIFCGDVELGTRKYCDPTLFKGSEDALYENLGRGRFRRLPVLVEADGKGLGVLWCDFDDDGRPDIYVANDLTANALYRNTGGMQFESVSWLSGAAVNREGKPEAGMGVALGDIDEDGDPDLMVTNFDVETNTIYRNDGALLFEDISAVSGFGSPSFNLLGFGIALTDIDGNGTIDAYIANGHIFETPRRENITRPQRDLVLLGDGKGSFVEEPETLRSLAPQVGRGLAVGDIDNDGDPDLAILNNGGPLQLLENRSPPTAWLGIRLVDNKPNTEAIGAEVTLIENERRRTAWVHAGDSYQSSSERQLRFRGLATQTTQSFLEVRWPDGKSDRFPLEEIALSRYLTITREGIRSVKDDVAENRNGRGASPVLSGWVLFGVLLIGLVIGIGGVRRMRRRMS